jgi:hypothetical protein
MLYSPENGGALGTYSGKNEKKSQFSLVKSRRKNFSTN